MAGTMLARMLRAITMGVVALVAIAGTLYLANAAPDVEPVSVADIADPARRPYVVKLHARWCPVCMLTKAEWEEIEKAYADRVTLLVFDSTSDATVERSRIEAARLGLDSLWDRYAGASGQILVLDGETREILAEIGGNRPFADYARAIDEALERAQRRFR